MPDETHTLQRLYDSEINFSIEAFWDGGFSWRLGDHLNGYSASGSVDMLDAAVDAIAEAAVRHYPNSAFVQGLGNA